MPHTIIGKTTLANTIVNRLNSRHDGEAPGCTSIPVAVFLPMDGYHLYRAQLSAMPDPDIAHERRGAAFTFDDKAFYELVKSLRQNLLPETKTIYAPSFDHALKDPVADDIPIHPTARIVVLEGNYLSLNKGLWGQAAGLMDELWFVDVDFDVAKERLIERHVKAGIAIDKEAATRRAEVNDLVNGTEIVDGRLDVHEVIVSREDDNWKPEAQVNAG